MAALLYVCHIAKEEQTLHTYLKKGWEGTHHHDNTRRSRMNAIKKMEAMLCILLSQPHTDTTEHTYVCRITGAHTNARTKPDDTDALFLQHTHTHTSHTFLLIHLFSPCLICHSDDKLK